MNKFYQEKYFNSPIFQYDYAPIADAIVKSYNPKKIIEFGCGSGQLSKALGKRGVAVLALDGYAKPDFSGYDSIKFQSLDLNDETGVSQFLSQLNETYDLAVSLEVAEHLQPTISFSLIKWMTGVADVVVFSAAVPKQSGDGHINCRTHLDWYKDFQANHFVIADTIRGQFRHHVNVGMWYKTNTIDYVKAGSVFDKPALREDLTERLIEAEGFAVSECFHYTHQTELRDWALGLQPIKLAVRFRNMITRKLGKTSIDF
ncbi:class I SAM-dependent methyltransferase [Lacibacter sp. H407]|uniref:class I SAM-dependent methyltransferase n=1 Tax=Lacibacter sp. H407 TaxID=3133423 RepID=UPI0030C35739